MKFLIDIDVEPIGGFPISQEAFREHLQTYVFDATSTIFELSHIPGDLDHDQGGGDDYQTYKVTRAEVTSL